MSKNTKKFYKTMYGTENGKRIGKYGNVTYESNKRRDRKEKGYDPDPTGIYSYEDWI